MRMIVLAVRRLLIGVASIYCLGLVALMICWTTPALQTWWLALSNVFALFVFGPLLLLVPAALVVRSRWLRGVVLASIAVFVALFGARFIPPGERSRDGAALRVLTLNQLQSNQRYDDLLAAIRAQDADVVALQELPADFARVAGQRLSSEYPYQFLTPIEGDYGLGILSRYPLRAMAHLRGFEGLRVVLDMGSRQVTLINVHLTAPSIKTRRFRPLGRVKMILDYDTSRRSREFANLLGEIDGVRGPLVVLGDFNTGDREPPYAVMAARMHDAYRETAWGFGFTFPNDKRMARMTVPFPLVRIDYVWSRGGVAPAAAGVNCDSGGSDHCMVVADLRVGDDEQPVAGERQATIDDW